VARGRNFPVLPVGGGLLVAFIALITVAIGISQSSTQNQLNVTPTVPATADVTRTPPGSLVNLSAPSGWPVLKNDLADMTYTGDDAFAAWTSTFANSVLEYQLSARSDVAYPVPIEGHDVGQQFHYAVDAKQLSGPPSASYGVLIGYPFGARAADASTSYYEFVVDDRSEARFALRQDGVWKTLWQSSAVGVVKPGDTNAFVVHGESVPSGTHFTLFLNGQYVTDLVDNQLVRPGAVGVLMVLESAGDAATWEFTNLELRAPPASP
jgi:hypothetical protein